MMKKTLFAVTKPWLGTVEEKDREFAVLALEKFFHNLESEPVKPYAVCFYTEGVKACCEGSPFFEALEALDKKGVKILVAQISLDYYHLRNKVVVGNVVDMNDIVGMMMIVDQVITV